MKATGKAKSKKLRPAKDARRAHRRTKRAACGSATWIRDLASPYLQGYEPAAAHEEGLDGYWFFASALPAVKSPYAKRNSKAGPNRRERAGFFVGYLQGATADYSFLRPEPPECAVFAWVKPTNSPLHERLVRQQGSLVRKVFEYIRWLTHRPPRFVFHEAEVAAMARHASMKDWPPEKREHLSRNFFIETLAWLVRSGLVRKLREEAVSHSAPHQSG